MLPHVDSPVNSPTLRAKPGTNTPKVSAIEPTKDVLTLLTVPVHRPEDGLDVVLERLRSHNEMVTMVIVGDLKKEVADSSGIILGYAHGGVLISFGTNDSDQALLAAALVVERMRQAEGQGRPEVRIGLSRGPIEKKRWDAGSPLDLWGEPIEIAKRLVSDVAQPGQIVLDSAACKTADLELVKKIHPKADIYPVPGVKLTIHGAGHRRAISELTLGGQQRKPQNRRQLADELNHIQSTAMQLRFKLKEAEDLSLQFDHPQQREREIGKFAEIVNLLDSEDPNREAKDLVDAWDSAVEAGKNEDLQKAYGELQEAIQSLVDTWQERSEEVRNQEGGNGAAAACKGAIDRVVNKLNVLYRRVTRALSGIDELL
jgi:hypothetical protein